jgi:ABC-type bacteriocin/lantibiotic exporter with double-glycine peptidase domain
LENVSFSYEKDKRKIINDLSYTLENNYFYGIRGRTGVGKSTFLDIVSGLLMPDEGEIKINNKKINFLENNWFNKISYVTQNINLLDDTLENNIALAVNPSEIDKDKILKVIDSAELKNFDKSYSYDSNLILGERGIKISGGEKQRIGIARCLYFDRDIYIFDEATNALDSLTEIKILEKIKSFLKNKIVIVVSHKESTLKFCDKIIDIN